jgi:hypothetical protein
LDKCAPHRGVATKQEHVMNPFSATARVSGAAALLALSGCYYVGPGYYPYGYYGSYPPVPTDATQHSVAVPPNGAPPDYPPDNHSAQQAQAAPPPQAAYAAPPPPPGYAAPGYYPAYPAYYPAYPAYYPAYPAYYGWPGWGGPAVSLHFGYWGGGGHGWHHH